MKYEKPQLTEMGLASRAIESTGKGPGPNDLDDFPTVGAYEADE